MKIAYEEDKLAAKTLRVIRQANDYEPPPNPAKETDSRFAAYRELFGEQSWELDALEPTVLAQLVKTEIATLVDWDLWEREEKRELQARAELAQIADNYPLALRLVEEAMGDR